MSLDLEMLALMDSLADVLGSTRVIPADFQPTTELSVWFGSKAVLRGNSFIAGECKQPPTIAFEAEDDAPNSASYCLILADPDAPMPDDQKFAYWRHYHFIAFWTGHWRL